MYSMRDGQLNKRFRLHRIAEHAEVVPLEVRLRLQGSENVADARAEPGEAPCDAAPGCGGGQLEYSRAAAFRWPTVVSIRLANDRDSRDLNMISDVAFEPRIG